MKKKQLFASCLLAAATVMGTTACSAQDSAGTGSSTENTDLSNAISDSTCSEGNDTSTVVSGDTSNADTLETPVSEDAASGTNASGTSAAETNASGTSASEAVYIEPVFARWQQLVTASVGEVRFPVFIIDFQDVKYKESLASKETLEEWIFTGDSSMAAYYNTASYGRLHMDGDVYFYTAKGKMEEYETHEALENLIVEAFAYYDEETDFSQYDQNGDYVMDSLIISVPSGGNEDFWWAATHTWYCLPDYTIDDTYIVNYIVNDIQPYSSSRSYFLETLEHEMGHCLGLPDYYKYEYVGTDYEGMHGLAGKEIMDDSEGDFCQFSKLLLGWLTTEQVQIMPSDADSASFLVPPACEGGCILIFPRGQEANFQDEYFVVEYNTPEGLMRGILNQSGVRVMHAQAEMIEYDSGYFEYKYGNYSEYYDHSNNGIRVLKLVNDGNGFFHEGDTVTYENTGAEKGNFGWYTEDGQISDPGFHIQIGEFTDAGASIEIIWDD